MQEYITKQMLILSAVITFVIIVCIFITFYIQTSNSSLPSAGVKINPDDTVYCDDTAECELFKN